MFLTEQQGLRAMFHLNKLRVGLGSMAPGVPSERIVLNFLSSQLN